jgi:hypothetical protein
VCVGKDNREDERGLKNVLRHERPGRGQQRPTTNKRQLMSEAGEISRSKSEKKTALTIRYLYISPASLSVNGHESLVNRPSNR